MAFHPTIRLAEYLGHCAQRHWSSEHGLVLAQQKVEGKTNEIKAVPLILKVLNLNGVVNTLDAMGTQPDIVHQIKAGGGDYVIGLKGNQGKLNQGIRDWFQAAETQGWRGISFSADETINGGHHRIERRQVIAVATNYRRYIVKVSGLD